MKEDLGIGKLTISVIAAALLANIAAADAQQASDPRVADLVQAGMVRVGLFSTQYTKDPASGELRGVRVDIARALAAQIGVPAVLLEHGTPPDVVQCLEAGACDVVFLPRDERAANVGDFSPPYLQSEYTMLVPEGSSIRSIADADKPGIRIAAVRSHSSTMTLTSAIKQAEVILGENELAAFELLRAGRADALASTRLHRDAETRSVERFCAKSKSVSVRCADHSRPSMILRKSVEVQHDQS